MDRERYIALKKVVVPLGHDIEPEPRLGEDVAYFDITSEEVEINPQRLLNAINKSDQASYLGNLGLILAQPYRISFEDYSAF